MKSSALHLGAFDQSIQGWTNTDITPHLFIARIPLLPNVMRAIGLIDGRRLTQHEHGTFRHLKYLNVARRFPFRDNAFHCIYSSHMLEHLHPAVAEHCILECRRVLAPEGVLRIAVPDFDLIIAAYNPVEPAVTLDAIFELGSKGAKNRHWWAYNEASLAQLLLKSGLHAPCRCAYGESRHKRLVGVDNRPGSLIVEAVK